MAIWDNVNFTPIATAFFTALVVPWCVLKFTDRHKSRILASDKEIQARADYVMLLQERVSELERTLDTISKREFEALDLIRKKYEEQIDQMNRRWRHLTNNLIQYANSVVFKLRKYEDVAEFTGWERFIEEGGNIPSEWKKEELSK